MLDSEPHYTVPPNRRDAVCRGCLGRDTGIQRQGTLDTSWIYCRRLSGQGGGKVYPLKALPDEAQSKIRRPARPKPTQPAPADSASVQKEPNDKKRLFLSLGLGQRARVEAKAEAVASVETLQTAARLQGDIYRGRLQGFLHTLEGWSGRSGGAARTKPCRSFAARFPMQMGQGSGEGRSERTGGPARSGAGGTRHPRHGYTRCATWFSVCWLSTHMPARPTSRKGWRCVFSLVRTASRPFAPSSTGRKNGGRRTRYCGHTYAIRTLRKVATAPSVGRADEGVDSLNALWEIDTTTADVLLSDGQRHTIRGIIDVWSRRMLLHVARTSSSTAVCTTLRRAILAWGVPNVVRCDNGKEFISNHTRTALKDLGIVQKTASALSAGAQTLHRACARHVLPRPA